MKSCISSLISWFCRATSVWQSGPGAGNRGAQILRRIGGVLLNGLFLSGCSNSPYEAGVTAQKVVYAAQAEDPKTLDPSIAYDGGSLFVIGCIYPSYFQYHYLKRNPSPLELALGAEEPKRDKISVIVTENGKRIAKQGERWTFKIKKGLRFQDDPCFPGGKGREITAADFLFCFRRMANPKVPCPIVQNFDGKIIGMAQYEEVNRARIKEGQKADLNYPIEGLELDPDDPYVFRIVLNQPYPQLRYWMAMPFTSPLAHEAIAKYGNENFKKGQDVPDDQKFSRHPVGCGAFLLEEWKQKSRITLKVNPNRMAEFYPSEGEPGDREMGLLAAAGKQLPLVDTVQINTIKEGVTNWNLFLQGYQDFAGVSQENYQQVMNQSGQLSEDMKRRGIKLFHGKALGIDYMGFNMNDPIVGGYSEKNRKLRQAISMAIDSRTFIDLMNQGLGVPAESLIPPGVPGYEADYKNPYRQYDPNLTKAKQLLSEAGYPNGIDPKTGDRLTLYWDNYLTNARGRVQIGLITRQVEALKIKLESRSSPYPTFQDKVGKGQFQIINWGWGADYPDAENFVFMLYGPNWLNAGPNSCNYANPEYDKLFEQMRSMDDGPERMNIIRKMRAIAEEDCPWIFMLHGESFGMTQGWLQNYKPLQVGATAIKYWDVDGAMRARLQAEWNRPNYWPIAAAGVLFVLGCLPAFQVVRARSRRRVRLTKDV